MDIFKTKKIVRVASQKIKFAFLTVFGRKQSFVKGKAKTWCQRVLVNCPDIMLIIRMMFSHENLILQLFTIQTDIPTNQNVTPTNIIQYVLHFIMYLLEARSLCMKRISTIYIQVFMTNFHLWVDS